MNSPYHIRWMIRRDMPQVLAIEQLGFRWPWTEETFIGELKNRNTIGMVAEHDDDVVGYMVYELNNTFLELINFAAHPFAQRRGVGRAMVAKLAEKIIWRRERVVIYIDEGNCDGQLFFRACGFECVDIARGYYLADDGEHDAYRFELTRAAARRIVGESQNMEAGR